MYLTTGMDPALSADGKMVAFTRWDGSGNGASGSLWVTNVDGSNPYPLFSQAVQDSLNIQYNGVDEQVISWR